MFYISIDIETSGLDSEKNCILSFGAIIEDTENKLPFDELPKFYRIINQKNISGSPYALNMNKDIIKDISIYQEGSPSEELKASIIEEEELAKEFYDFLWENNLGEPLPFEDGRVKNGKVYPFFSSKTKPIRINVAGKNFATLDKLFLEKVYWWQKLIKMRHKLLDPGILYVDWKNDEQVPHLDLCKQRAGIEGVVTHNALDDAWDVIELLRKQY